MLSEGLCEEVVPGSQQRGRAARLHYLAVAFGRGKVRHGCVCVRGCGARGGEGHETCARPPTTASPPRHLRHACWPVQSCYQPECNWGVHLSTQHRVQQYIIIQGKVWAKNPRSLKYSSTKIVHKELIFIDYIFEQDNISRSILKPRFVNFLTRY